MAAEILLSTGVILIALLSCKFVARIIRILYSQRQFRKKSPALPVLEKAHWLAGHGTIMFWSKDSWLNLDKAHKSHGETFGWHNIDKPAVSTIDLDLIRKIILDEPDRHINRIDGFGIAVSALSRDSVITAEDEQWRRLRRAITPAFTNHKVMSANVQDELEKVNERFLASIERKIELAEPKVIEMDVDEVFCRYSIALTFSCFYKQEHVIDFDAKEDFYVKNIEETLAVVEHWMNMICPLFPFVIPLVEWLIDRYHVQGLIIRKIIGFIREQSAMNLKAKQEMKMAMNTKKNLDNFVMQDGTIFRPNMIDYIIDRFRAGDIGESEYLNSSFSLFVAAFKTLSDALARLAYLLAAHRDVQTKLRDSVLLDGANSEYLFWCISESLRLFPPVNAGCPRVIACDVKSKVGLIPTGTFVFTPAFTIHRHKDHWGPDADEFKPDRWRDAKSFHPMQYLAFGAGKRSCIGKEFALATMKKLMVDLLTRYEFHPSPRTDATSIMRFGTPIGLFMTSDTPTFIKLRRIKDQQLID